SMIEGRIPDADIETNMQASDYKLEGLLRKAADRLVQSDRLVLMIQDILQEVQPESIAEALAILHLQGFTYLQDFYPQEVFDAVSDYFALGADAENEIES